jgi:hypothetical protein
VTGDDRDEMRKIARIAFAAIVVFVVGIVAGVVFNSWAVFGGMVAVAVLVGASVLLLV